MPAFVYDGDGNRVKATFGTTTIVYIGNYYEQQGTASTKYYYAGSQRIALRRSGYASDNGLFWLLTDHLGSTAITANSDGSYKAELRYKAWGETRYTSGTTLTTYRFTGQREDATIGLYFYNARYYDPALGRFLQPDSLVQADAKNPTPYLALAVSYANPKMLEQWNQLQRARLQAEAQPLGTPTVLDPQFLNRYSYVRNNPLAFVDPDGNLAWFVAPLVGGALIGGTISTAGYLLAARLTGHEVTAGGVVGAFASGAVAGAVSVFATPLAGSALKLAGMAATNTALTAGAAAVNAAGGATAYLAGGAVENVVNQAIGEGVTFKPALGGAALNAVTAGVLNIGLSKAFPVDNNIMRTMRQAAHFMPGRKAETIVWSALIPGNAQNLYWRQTAVSVGVGSASGVGYQNLLAE